MQDEHDNLIAFPVPPTRRLRLLLEQAGSAATSRHIALDLLRYIEATETAERCPWCRLPPPAQDV